MQDRPRRQGFRNRRGRPRIRRRCHTLPDLFGIRRRLGLPQPDQANADWLPKGLPKPIAGNLRFEGFKRSMDFSTDGQANTFDHEEYWKLSGQRFWELISGETDFYTRIIEPLAMRAKTRNEEFSKVYGRTINRLVAEFIERFVRPDFLIDWPALVRFNSESAARPDRN